mgnify:CR=1 FL=1
MPERIISRFNATGSISAAIAYEETVENLKARIAQLAGPESVSAALAVADVDFLLTNKSRLEALAGVVRELEKQKGAGHGPVQGRVSEERM